MNILSIVNFKAVADAGYDFFTNDVSNFIREKADIIEKHVVQWEKDNSKWDFGLSVIPIVGGVMQAIKEYTIINEWDAKTSSINDTFSILARKERCKTLGIISGLVACVASAFFFSMSGVIGGLLIVGGGATIIANLYTSLSNQKLAHGLRTSGLSFDKSYSQWQAKNQSAEIL